MKNNWNWLLYGCLIASAGNFAFASRTQAAESVILQYGILQGSISVEELSTFALSGELSSSLKSYLRLSDTKPEDLRKVLTKEVDLDGVSLSRTLNSLPGEILLDQVGTIIRPRSRRASRQALRAALVNSALSDDQITLIEVIENYPTDEIYVEGDRLVNAYNSIRRGVEIASRLGF